MAVRTVVSTLMNFTDQALLLTDSSTSHGRWTQASPTTINPGATGTVQAESHGFMTGTFTTGTWGRANAALPQPLPD